MKHILMTCDSCNKTVPQHDVKGWWGHKKSGGQVIFAPYIKSLRKEFESGHVCSEECLALVLKNYAVTTDRKAVKQTASNFGAFSFYDLMRGGPHDDSGISDSIGYNGKPKEAKPEEDDE